MRTAFEGCCAQMLAHRFPTHPDFDPNGRGVPVKLTELDTVLSVVEQAVQDKMGRYEVPRADIATMKKIANPLKIGIMHEAAFVLGRHWPDLLARKAGTAAVLTVAQLRVGIDEEEPGLPEQVQNLLIACYAVQADKAWLRADRPAEPPWLDKVPNDLALRSQELPGAGEFDTASARAAGIFGIARHPVRNARSVHALADAIRRNAKGRLEAAGGLAAELDQHAQTLGLDETADRMVTSRILAVLSAAVGTVGIVKPQSAFYERHGWRGIRVLTRLVASAREAGLLVIMDAKRGDVGSTNDAYAQAYLGPGAAIESDALTVSPYLGLSAMGAYTSRAAQAGACVFVVVRSSNPEGRAIQAARTPSGTSAEQHLLAGIGTLNSRLAPGVIGPVGAVVAAGNAAGDAGYGADPGLDLAAANALFLVPGIGAQGAAPQDVARTLAACPERVLPSASRSLLAPGPDPAAIRDAAARLNEKFAALLRV